MCINKGKRLMCFPRLSNISSSTLSSNNIWSSTKLSKHVWSKLHLV